MEITWIENDEEVLGQSTERIPFTGESGDGFYELLVVKMVWTGPRIGSAEFEP